MKIDRTQIVISALLVAVNVILFNLIVGEFRGLRADLTDGKVFSLSPTTERLLAGLKEPVEITAYVSADENIHEDVRPLVPEVMDLLEEYEIKGGSKVRLRRIVPEEDEKAEKEARRDYRIRPQIGIFRDARAQGVQSFYLSLVVKYPGSDAITLNADDLITQNVFAQEQSLELKNVELELTKAIKKAVLGFESKRNLFRRFPTTIELTTFITPADQMPPSLKDVPGRIDELLDDLAARSEGKLVHVKADLGDEALLKRLRVPALDVEGLDHPLHLAMILKLGDQSRRLSLLDYDGARSNEDIEGVIMGVVRSASPGVLRRVGVAQYLPDPDGRMRMMGQPSLPPAYLALARTLGQDYDVVDLDLGQLRSLPADLDLLIVMEPAKLDERAAYLIDQYVMGGGKTIFCLDRSDSSMLDGTRQGAEARDSGLEELLATWGVKLQEGVVLDPNCGEFFDTRSREGTLLEGPWMSSVEVGLDEGGVNREVGYMRAFEAARFWFPGSIELTPVAGLSQNWLLRSGAESFVRKASPQLVPDLASWPKSAFEPARADEKRGRRILAAEISGVFPSHWADKPAPKKEKEAPTEEEAEPSLEIADQPIPSSRPTRMVVVANGEFLDLVQAQVESQAGPKYALFSANARFLVNAIDWLLEDDDLAAIRNRGRSFRPIERLEEGAQNRTMLLNFVLPLVGLAALGGTLYWRRRLRRPLI
ncbi:MAG: Gldg family protein [Planctomycetes bacterium]|nr:Gldg family protein [Planctomycetota bacterium]